MDDGSGRAPPSVHDGAMQLALSIVDPRRTGPPADVVVNAEPAALFASVRRQLAATVGLDGASFFCGAELVEDGCPLGRPPLIDGALLTIDEPDRSYTTEQPDPADRFDGAAPRGLLELHVRSGPDCGAVLQLAPGEYEIGRAPEARIRIEDPDVSRLHALLRVGSDGGSRATVHDLDSTNGTTLDGTRIGRAGARLRPGEALRVGSTSCELVVPDVVPVSCLPDGAGHLSLNRPPRVVASPAPVRVRYPAAPPEPERTQLPLIALAVPLLAGLGLVAMTRNPTYLVFVLVSPLMLVGSFLGDRSSRRRSGIEARRVHAAEMEAARSAVARALGEEVQVRHRASPDLASLLICATGPRPRLWERRPPDPDFLEVRLGLGTVSSFVEVATPAGDSREEITERPDLAAVPVALRLREAGVVGLAGSRGQLLRLARSLVCQVCGWHSPRYVSLVVLAVDGGTDWEWTRWLPHVRPPEAVDSSGLVGTTPAQVATRVDELISTLDARLADLSRSARVAWPGPSTLVVLDSAESLRRLPGVARLLAEGPAAGLLLLCLESRLVSLPAECRATVAIEGCVGTRLRVVTDDTTVNDVMLDGVSSRWAHRFARALAPLRDATPDDEHGGFPPDVRLLDLFDFDATDAAALARSWRDAPRSTRCVIGVCSDGAEFVVDLARDGPHTLVAGTTGSGKSELLQTLVAGLAIANRPDEMCFVLVDYKGGAAFTDCARLPHTVGLVTDLDGHLTKRALESLGAELRRRERILRDVGCADLESYLKAAPASATDTAPAMPRLVLVVDEFATLAEELPEFLGGLVGVAARGRSLGVHLVLATQRPGGVVSADIRANTALRIALRVTDPTESADVVDVRDAADISRTTPGRAIVRLAVGVWRQVQTARVGGRARPRAGATVRHVPWHQVGSPAPAHSLPEPVGPTDLGRIVAAAREAAALSGVIPAPRPWLPPLPTVLTLADMADLERSAGAEADAVTIGSRDLPLEQRRDPLAFRLAQGEHLLVAGGPRTGRTTVLRTIAAAIITTHHATDVHLYAFDGDGGLSALADLPHCGAVVARDQTDRGARLLQRLDDLLTARQQQLAASGLGSVDEQRNRADPADRVPWVIVMVDGWEALQQAYDNVDQGRPLDVLTRLVHEGGSAGFRVVLTGGRALLTSRVGTAIRPRLVLALADRADYGLAGITPSQVPAATPPGRALLGPEAVEVQVAVLSPDPSGAAQVTGLQRLASSHRPRAGAPDPTPAQRPIRVAPLPSLVRLATLAPEAKAVATGPAWLIAGVGGDEALPLGVDLDADGPAFVVAGRPGSGRSMTLVAMGRWLLSQSCPVAVVAHRRSPVRRLREEPGSLGCLDATAADQLTALLVAHPELVVLVDDVETVHDTPIERPLLAMLRADSDSTGAVVIAGSLDDLAAAFRGLAVEARRGRTGLLLGPLGPGDGDVLGVRLRAGGGPPGRATLVVRGRSTPVQVPYSPM